MSNKLSSRKFWITLWAMSMLTYGLITKTDLAWFSGLAPILGAIVAVYIGANAYLEGKKSKDNASPARESGRPRDAGEI